jgi:hypothetical protein
MSARQNRKTVKQQKIKRVKRKNIALLTVKGHLGPILTR